MLHIIRLAERRFPESAETFLFRLWLLSAGVLAIGLGLLFEA